MERRLAGVSRWWIDDLRDALVVAEGEHEGLSSLARFGEAFPASYREQYGPKAAVMDIRRLAALDDEGFTDRARTGRSRRLRASCG